MHKEIVASVCIAWYIFIACVCAIGDLCLFLYYRRVPRRAAVLSKDKKDIPHVTVIRPCKGREPYLYECLVSTILQDYPVDRLTVHFCVTSRSDAAFETVQQVVKDYPGHDARIFVEEEDNGTVENGSHRESLGPNPKIRNMSRAYREAKGDLLWIIDCNVWVGRGSCGRMVDLLCGFTAKGPPAKPYKLVHHLPVSVDVDTYSAGRQRTNTSSYDETTATPLLPDAGPANTLSRLNRYGGRLEELFLSSSHAKMYVAINMVAVAPCIVGKSNMFRRSHLDHLTSQRALAEDTTSPALARTGIDYFSSNICEDHLIGDLLWKSKVPALAGFAKRMRNHGLVLGDLAIQPVAGMTVANYIARRVRWLRVRKFTVPVATLVEPGTESLLCSACGAFGVTTCQYTRHLFGDTWSRFALWWLVSVVLWASVDWMVFLLLQSGRTVGTTHTAGQVQNVHALVPEFAKPRANTRRPFKTWLRAWLGREALAFPVWAWAIWGGVTVTWRDRRFWVGLDMRVHEIRDDTTAHTGSRPAVANGHAPVGRIMNGTAHADGKKRTD